MLSGLQQPPPSWQTVRCRVPGNHALCFLQSSIVLGEGSTKTRLASVSGALTTARGKDALSSCASVVVISLWPRNSVGPLGRSRCYPTWTNGVHASVKRGVVVHQTSATLTNVCQPEGDIRNDTVCIVEFVLQFSKVFVWSKRLSSYTMWHNISIGTGSLLSIPGIVIIYTICISWVELKTSTTVVPQISCHTD